MGKMKKEELIPNLEQLVKDNGGKSEVSRGSDVRRPQLDDVINGTGNPTKEVVNRLRAFFGLKLYR